MARQVLEGTWEEIAAHADELTGKRVRVIVEPETVIEAVAPNFAMLNAMREADEIQKGMNPKLESDGVAILREGRQGAMYGESTTE